MRGLPAMLAVASAILVPLAALVAREAAGTMDPPAPAPARSVALLRDAQAPLAFHWKALSPAERAWESAPPKTCRCGAVLPEGARFCPKCGAEVPKPPPAPARCSCGELLPEGARFCPKCGAKVQGAAPAPAPTPAPTPAAPEEDLSPDAMTDELIRAIEPLRQDRFAAPPLRRVLSAAEGRRLLEAELDGRYAGAQPNYIEACARLVGLIPPGCPVRQTYLDLLQNDVHALYVDTTRTLNLIQPSGQSAPVLARRLAIVQELANALDHQKVFGGANRSSLELRVGRTHDATVALMAVIEGSGTLLTRRYLAQAQQAGKISRSATLQYAEFEETRNRRFLERPVYFHAFLGAHVCGMNFLVRGQPGSAIADGKATGEDELRAAAKDLPTTTEEVLHPEKFFDPQARDQPIVIQDASVERSFALIGGWNVAFRDTFGEMFCALLANPKDPRASPMALTNPAHYTNEAAAGWGGDRFYLLVKAADLRLPLFGGFVPGPARDLGAGAATGVWVTAWDTAKDRDEFLRAYEANTPLAGRAVERFGDRTAVFLFDFGAAERETILQRMRAAPPTLMRAGASVPL